MTFPQTTVENGLEPGLSAVQRRGSHRAITGRLVPEHPLCPQVSLRFGLDPRTCISSKFPGRLRAVASTHHTQHLLGPYFV